MRAERMIKEYPNLKRELSVLEFQLSRCEGIDYDTVISSLTFSKPEGERVQTSGVSDVTARAALAYRKVADRMSDEWLSYLAGQYGQIKEELDFFEHAVRGLSGKLPEICMGYGCGAFHLGRTDDEISYQPYNGGEIPEESYKGIGCAV